VIAVKRYLAAVAMAACLGSMVPGAWAAKIVVESESYRTIKPSMVVKLDRTASKGRCIARPLTRPHAASESGPRDAGYAEYRLSIPAAGTYQFWGRCWWYDACGNSFYVLVDSATVTQATPYVTDQTFRKWHWVAGPAVRLTAGEHTIRIQYREDGAQMDQFLLTTTPRSRWTPPGPPRLESETPQYLVR
jgi:hypothetical protein